METRGINYQLITNKLNQDELTVRVSKVTQQTLHLTSTASAVVAGGLS